MSKLFSLVKAAMSEGMNIFTYHAKDEKSKRTVPLALAGVAFLSIFIYTNTLTVGMRETGTQYAILALFAFATSLLTIFEGIAKSGSLLFDCRDNDMLLAMPIKKSRIVFLRILKFYVFELIYNSLFLAPAILSYMLNVNVDMWFYVTAITMVVLLPIIPVAISCTIGAITSALSAKFIKRNTTQVVLQVIVALAFLVAILIGSFKASGFARNIGEIAGGMSDSITQIYYPANAFVKLATSFNILDLLIFIAINAAIFMLLIAIIGKFYFKIVTSISIVRKNAKASKKVRIKQHKPAVAIIRKELAKYFSTPVLFTNTAVGLVLFALAVGAVCFKFDSIANALAEQDFPLTLEEILSYSPSVLFVMVAFTSLMTFITTTMISLEGKAFNSLKVMPISGKKVMLSKIATAMILIIPVILIGDIVMFVRFRFGIPELLLILAASFILPFVTETIGILIDLKYARFDAESDAEVVKQSTGVMISSFLGLGMTVVTNSILIGLAILLGQIPALMIVDGIFIVVSVILYKTLSKKAEQRYRELSA